MNNATVLDADFLRDLSLIAQNQSLVKRLKKYVGRLAKSQTDESLMTKEQFFARIDKAKREVENGEVFTMLPNESFQDFRKRVGI
ncbi:MAG: hypothetical protein IJ835_05955 [Muribaculaceae bacterium]|nr:hypothetical protein [Muribaculaceae bacterium]